jgi:hypothetical protein
MEKINLKSFENDCMTLDGLMEVRGGSGNVSNTSVFSTTCMIGDHDANCFDSDPF